MIRNLLVCFLFLALAAACSSRREVQSRPAPVVASTGDEQPAEPEPDPSDVHLEGEYITIDHHILFALDSDEILPESAEIIDHLATFLANHQAEVASLEVIGHTDAQGGRAHNQDLSQRRAAAVVSALQQRGVSQALQAIGRGMDERLCTENTDECHARNRRVVFHVVRQ